MKVHKFVDNIQHEAYDIEFNLYLTLRFTLIKNSNTIFARFLKRENYWRYYNENKAKTLSLRFIKNISLPKYDLSDWNETGETNLDDLTKRLYFEIIKQKYNEK